ncbi:phosphonate degradation HD-domain oxygenase [Rubinisphaera sp.]|uniref:phosphonate degradation HD-domain oxygenase n=1 Tax=Rubinisphaera sp. TaxID=2024857 RepID=UPI000C0FD1B6|nr:phosphonate degradation HD-domain oxygenase [Rubinisphaera sp.]MBV11592.1 metal-dependent phosphohydrolase [Rubinisphaera sp.]HCS53996.1 metal-dependent phosphohydrolase [Planctomycetaceae bacterium]|tara:strand:- start:72 stop:620 length:549 start_codon:yes stop_codon:yes gene_type:complete
MPTVDDVLLLFQSRGNSQYGGEAVTQQEHALQAATLADAEGASDALITAALLHDVGHLLHDLPEESPEMGVDDHHEGSGYHYLNSIFPAEVTEPIRLHVAAKRYLCAVDPNYQSCLSEPSIVSLNLQGGAMSSEEVRAFDENPHREAAVRLRRWDDEAKVANLTTPLLSYFQPIVHSAANPA